MKCIHCSARVDRTDWFCPNCKRSVPRRRPLVPGRTWIPVAALLVVGSAALTVGVLRWTNPTGTPDAEVTIREVPLVQIAAHAVQPAAALDTRRTDRDEEREARKPEIEPVIAVAHTDEPPIAPQPAVLRPDGIGAITVSTDQPVQTFVYLNGGTLLGEAPLRNASIPAGKHRLVFWSPSVGGRSTRTVEVAAGENLEVVEHVRTRESFREDAGG